MKKALSLVLALALTLSFAVPSMAAGIGQSAQGVNITDQSAVAYLESYLSYLKEGKVEDAYSMMEDTRMVLREDINVRTLSAAELEYIEYNESGAAFADEYAQEAIVDYEILGLGQTGNTIMTKLYFADGSDAIVPFDVVQNENGYMVKVTGDDLYEKGYAEGTISSTKVVEEESSVTPRYSGYDLLDEYEFWDLYGDIYGIDTFNITKQVIQITGQQWNAEYENGYLTEAAVIYKIVVKHWYGDTVWGTTTNPVIKNGYFSVYLQGKNANTSNARIKIVNTTGSMPFSKGSGDVYQCNQ